MEPLESIVARFAVDGRFLFAEPYGNGHINDTYLVHCETPAGPVRYILQRINRNVFRQPEELMDNVRRVTEHLAEKVAADGGRPGRECLSLVPTRAGAVFLRTEQGDFWRTYRFVEGAHTYDEPQAPRQSYEAARAFARFQSRLSDLPGPRLHETIPHFHDTPRRFTDFLAAVERDPLNRAKNARGYIDFVLAHADQTGILVDLLAAGRLPERITHNDTKFNNVMLDDDTGEAVCVIDLDTCMPGVVMYDFGDAVRTGTATAAEDEPDVDRAGFDMAAFEQLARGYLEGAEGFLTPPEIDQLPFSCILMTLECGMRFLADHVEGDVYFKTSHSFQNLYRARTQFKMVTEMEQRHEQMAAIVRRYAGAGPSPAP